MSGGTQLEPDDFKRWTRRPFAARALRTFALSVPLATSLVAAYVLARVFPPATGIPGIFARFFLIAAISTLVLATVERVARRLLPMVALLDLSLVFPDRAPSRFRVAIRNGTTSQLKKRIAELDAATDGATVGMAERLLGLVAALSVHDRLTRGHSERVRAYAQMIATELGMSEHELDQLRWSALLHDIGKLRIDPAILNKPGKLTPAEFEIIKQHPTIGFAFTAPLAAWLGDSVRAVAEHHERWDGGGYPNALAGTEISFAARIVSVADAFDVMTSVRSYKPPQSASAARAELARCSGSQFDPVVVRAFLGLSIGALWFRIGPLSWLAQASLVPRTLATGLNSRLAELAALAGLAVSGLVAVPNVPSRQPVLAEERNDTSFDNATLREAATESATTTTVTTVTPPTPGPGTTTTTTVAVTSTVPPTTPPTTLRIPTTLTLPTLPTLPTLRAIPATLTLTALLAPSPPPPPLVPVLPPLNSQTPLRGVPLQLS